MHLRSFRLCLPPDRFCLSQVFDDSMNFLNSLVTFVTNVNLTLNETNKTKTHEFLYDLRNTFNCVIYFHSRLKLIILPSLSYVLFKQILQNEENKHGVMQNKNQNR